MSTLLVNPDRCTRCGRCSAVCPMGIVAPPGPGSLPRVPDDAAARCTRSGHSEPSCPAHALLLHCRPDQRTPLPPAAGSLSPSDLIPYLKKRRSIRRFTPDPVPRDQLLSLLDAARYAASGGNGQPVQWLVLSGPSRIRTVSALTLDWMQTLLNTPHPLAAYVPALLAGWQAGHDVICLNAPHLLFAHVPQNVPIAQVDAIIALAHVDIAAPALGIGTCWAGFVSAAAASHLPLQEELALPAGRKPAYALMLGHPRFLPAAIPRRNPLAVTWR